MMGELAKRITPLRGKKKRMVALNFSLKGVFFAKSKQEHHCHPHRHLAAEGATANFSLGKSVSRKIDFVLKKRVS